MERIRTNKGPIFASIVVNRFMKKSSGAWCKAIKLYFSAGAARKYELKNSTVDIFWDEESGCIVVKRPGVDRRLVVGECIRPATVYKGTRKLTKDKKYRWAVINITSLVRDFRIPKKKKCEIMEVNEDEIWVEVIPPIAEKLDWGKPSTHIKPEKLPDFRIKNKLLDMIKTAAKEEKQSLSKWIVTTVERRLEDEYRHLLELA